MKDYKKEYEHLTRLLKNLEHDIPETMAGYEKMQRNHHMNTALPAKTKELVALGISIVTKCEGCMTMHIQHALKAGATRAEIMEVIGVAVMMGGGPALIYACQAVEALEQFESNRNIARLYDNA